MADTRRLRSRWLVWLLGWAAASFVLFLVAVTLPALAPSKPLSEITWGTTFSAPYTRGLGLDDHAVYRAILDELKPAKLRLVSYWKYEQPAPGKWDFADLDFQVQEAEKRGVPYVIAVGRRVPRWPECFSPAWSKDLSVARQQDYLFRHLREVVRRYDANSHLTAWQVENETNVVFGDCPDWHARYLGQEVDLVRGLSDKPILITGGGETPHQGLQISRFADQFGTSLYRASAFNKTFFLKPIPPQFYTARAVAVRWLHPRVKHSLITELQAEPWGSGAGRDQAFYDRTLSPAHFDDNVRAARQTYLPEVWFWGAEWWYYEKQHGQPWYWQQARDIFAAGKQA